MIFAVAANLLLQLLKIVNKQFLIRVNLDDIFKILAVVI